MWQFNGLSLCFVCAEMSFLPYRGFGVRGKCLCRHWGREECNLLVHSAELVLSSRHFDIGSVKWKSFGRRWLRESDRGAQKL